MTTALDIAKQQATMQLETLTERVRSSFIGPLGASLTFSEESEEATDYAAAGYPTNTTSYPHIAIEASVTGQTPTAVATAILAKKAAWINASKTIKGIYLTAKAALNAATTVAEVETAITTAMQNLFAVTA